jgi:hypothetical protein
VSAHGCLPVASLQDTRLRAACRLQVPRETISGAITLRLRRPGGEPEVKVRKARALPWTRHAGGVLRTTGPLPQNPTIKKRWKAAKPKVPSFIGFARNYGKSRAVLMGISGQRPRRAEHASRVTGPRQSPGLSCHDLNPSRSSPSPVAASPVPDKAVRIFRQSAEFPE